MQEKFIFLHFKMYFPSSFKNTFCTLRNCGNLAKGKVNSEEKRLEIKYNNLSN
jgi:hypothetical protein